MKMNQNRRAFTVGALQLAGAAVALSAGLPAHAQKVSFAGKTVEWVVPFGTGGGTDVWARFLAPYLSKYLPGNLRNDFCFDVRLPDFYLSHPVFWRNDKPLSDRKRAHSRSQIATIA